MPRPKKLGPQKRRRFLNRIREGMEATAAAADCGFSRGRFYQLRLEDENFRAEWLAAEQDHLNNVRDEFLALIAERGDATAAALEIGVPRRTLYAWRARDAEFARQWETAAFEFDDAVIRGNLLAELEGGYTEQFVTQKKNDKGEWDEVERTAVRKTRPDHKLRYLQSRHPEFIPKRQVTGAGGGPIQHDHRGAIATVNVGDELQRRETEGLSFKELADFYQTVIEQSSAAE